MGEKKNIKIESIEEGLYNVYINPFYLDNGEFCCSKDYYDLTKSELIELLWETLPEIDF